MYYICIVDEGGTNGCVLSINYHSPQQHLIRVKEKISNFETKELLNKIAESRRNPKIIGAWSTNRDDDLLNIIDYSILMKD